MRMHMRHLPPSLFAVSLTMLMGAAKADPLPLDRPTTIGGLEVVCTGIGSAQDNPAWNAYPVRIVFSNGGAQFVAGEHVVISKASAQLASLDCMAHWVLVKAAPGSYKVDASLFGQPNPPTIKSATFSPPKTGQTRVEIMFAAVPPNQ